MNLRNVTLFLSIPIGYRHDRGPLVAYYLVTKLDIERQLKKIGSLVNSGRCLDKDTVHVRRTMKVSEELPEQWPLKLSRSESELMIAGLILMPDWNKVVGTLFAISKSVFRCVGHSWIFIDILVLGFLNVKAKTESYIFSNVEK